MVVSGNERFDPITKNHFFLYEGAGKPGEFTDIIFPENDHCPMCDMTAQATLGSSAVWTDQRARPVLYASQDTVVVPNRWSPVGDPPEGKAEMAFPTKHVLMPHHLTDKQFSHFAQTCAVRTEIMGDAFRNTIISFNVGANAGGTIAHLHAHISGTNNPKRFFHIETSQLEEDLRNAKREGLVITRGNKETCLYVPYAPASKAELRIQGSDTQAILNEVRSVLLRVENVGIKWAFNVLTYPQIGFAQICFHPKPAGVFGSFAGAVTSPISPGWLYKQIISAS